ncbi:hypothetical protein RJ640_001673 [Escallonia rubra]|uniref:Sm protein G n=1 Tax=Escallonia rubra TaxID=112253 RepID=A0AA88S2L2_9ASTE|nr:hypothetical protein RJ640_001673 [Escallonia rubra]
MAQSPPVALPVTEPNVKSGSESNNSFVAGGDDVVGRGEGAEGAVEAEEEVEGGGSYDDDDYHDRGGGGRGRRSVLRGVAVVLELGLYSGGGGAADDGEKRRRGIKARHCEIKLNANRMVVGTLRGFDQFMNLVIDNTVEVNGNENNDIGMVVSHAIPPSFIHSNEISVSEMSTVAKAMLSEETAWSLLKRSSLLPDPSECRSAFGMLDKARGSNKA